MTTYEFTLILELSAPPAGDEPFLELADQLMAAVAADAPLGRRSGVYYLEVSREAQSLTAAMDATIREVERVPGVRVVHVDGDLVTASEIAERIGKTRQAVQLMAVGERGPGRFPAPVVGASSQTRLWRWVDVLAWLGGEWASQVPGALEIARVNHRLNTRSLRALAKTA
jgi:hypothetical protein